MSLLPQWWKRLRLADAATVTLGQSPPGSTYNDLGHGVPFFQGKSDFTDMYAGVRIYTTGGTKFAQTGDILVSVRAPVGPTNITPVDCALGRGLAAVRAKDGVDQRYLLWALRATERELASRGAGSTFPAITGKQLREHVVNVPVLEEQRRIVEVLEDHLSRLGSARRAVSHSQIRLNRLRQSVLNSTLQSARSQDSEVHSIGEIAAVSTGATPLKARDDYYVGGTIPWVTSAELKQGLIGNPIHFITERALSETSVKLFPAGTLLVAMYGEGKTRGTVGELAVAATTNQACAAVQLHDRDPSHRAWVRLALEANYWYLRGLASGGVQPNLNLSLVRQIQLPLPDADVRHSLLNDHDAQDQGRRRLESELRLIEHRESRLRAALLSAAFTGRLTECASGMDMVEEMAGG